MKLVRRLLATGLLGLATFASATLLRATPVDDARVQLAKGDDAGAYTLVATNAYGQATSPITTAKTNRPAQAAYESLGWVRDDVFYAYSKRVGG